MQGFFLIINRIVQEGSPQTLFQPTRALQRLQLRRVYDVMAEAKALGKSVGSRPKP